MDVFDVCVCCNSPKYTYLMFSWFFLQFQYLILTHQISKLLKSQETSGISDQRCMRRLGRLQVLKICLLVYRYMYFEPRIFQAWHTMTVNDSMNTAPGQYLQDMLTDLPVQLQVYLNFSDLQKFQPRMSMRQNLKRIEDSWSVPRTVTSPLMPPQQSWSIMIQ